MRKRTSVKLKNVTANHRANDVICRESEPQKLCARFMYGPLVSFQAHPKGFLFSKIFFCTPGYDNTSW